MVRGRERGKKGKRWAAAGAGSQYALPSRRRPLSFSRRHRTIPPPTAAEPPTIPEAFSLSGTSCRSDRGGGTSNNIASGNRQAGGLQGWVATRRHRNPIARRRCAGKVGGHWRFDGGLPFPYLHNALFSQPRGKPIADVSTIGYFPNNFTISVLTSLSG